MKKLKLMVDNREVEVVAMKMAGKVWFHCQGETYDYSPQSSLSHAGGEEASDPSKIMAPMPGKIIKVFAKPNQVVKEGETLVVMEAMKMEYNLKAGQDMVVQSVLCQENAQVGLGELLVELESQ